MFSLFTLQSCNFSVQMVTLHFVVGRLK